jgi:hypothetical protein
MIHVGNWPGRLPEFGEAGPEVLNDGPVPPEINRILADYPLHAGRQGIEPAHQQCNFSAVFDVAVKDVRRLLKKPVQELVGTEPEKGRV